MNDSQVDTELTALLGDGAFPPTPGAIPQRVRLRLRRRRRWRIGSSIAAVAVAFAAAAFFAWPGDDPPGPLVDDRPGAPLAQWDELAAAPILHSPPPVAALPALSKQQDALLAELQQWDGR